MTIQIAADTGGGYVAAAYLTFTILLIVYVGIMSMKLTRIQRGLDELDKHTTDAAPGNARKNEGD